MDPENPFARMAYTFMAATAGSITALSMMKWKEMSGAEVALTLFVGAAFAIFVAPWAASKWLNIDYNTDMQGMCAIVYAAGSLSNVLIPLARKKIIERVEARNGKDVQ
jgi:hypothetical protein